MKLRLTTSAILLTCALLGIGGLTFVVSSSLAAMFQLPVWTDAVVGALSFPIAGLAWHLARERARRGRGPGWLTGRARLVLRQLAACGVVLGVCFGLAAPQTVQALTEHRGWILGYTQARTEAGCDVRGGRHPDWRGDIDAGLAEAARAEKPALLYFSADWCHYCEELEREVLCAPEVAATLDADYIGVRVNERDLSQEVKDRYHVTGYPRLLLLAPDGRPRSFGPPRRERAVLREWLLEHRVAFHERGAAAPE